MTLRLYLLVDKLRAGPFRRWGKGQREVRSIIIQRILPGIGSAMPEGYLPQQYPWCFVISSPARRRKHAYSGAFMHQTGKGGETVLIVVYGAVSWPWLSRNMRDEFPLTFWAARILNVMPPGELVKKNWRPLWQWVKALRRAYSPFWETLVLTPVWRFKNQSQILLREGSQEDYYIQSSDGVEAMPWKDWPDCLKQEAGIWIWRQSRHRKIVDSQRIPLRCAEAKPPDASF